MADQPRDPLRRFRMGLTAWARDLPAAARLELSDDGRTVETHGVSREKRHELLLLAQRAGIDNAHAIEALLYLWLHQSVGKPNEGSSCYFHARRSERTVFRGSTKFEGGHIVGYFYPLREALLEYCNKLPQGVENDSPIAPEFTDFTESEATAAPLQNVTARSENADSAQVGEPSRPFATRKASSPGRETDEVAKARAEVVAKLIAELSVLKPQMFEHEGEYNLLQTRYPGYLTFKIAQDRPDLKLKIMCVRGSARHIRLAQELAAAHYGLSPATIAAAWKRHKPDRYKRFSRLG